MSMHDVEDATRSLTSRALMDIVRRDRGTVDRSLAATALLGRNQLRPVASARLIIDAPEARIDDKRAAIKALGRSLERGSQDLLIQQLSEPHPHVLRDAVWSLAKVGDREGLERLQQVVPRGSERLKEDVEAATRLLAFRLGERGFGFDKRRLPKKAAMPRENLKEMEISEVKPELLANSRKILSLEAAGLDLIGDKATQMVCLKQPLWLMPSKQAAAEPEALMERPAVAMAIFSHNGCTGVPFLKSYVMTEPTRGGVDIFVTRLRGQPTHVGQAKVSREGLSFEMAALQTRYDPAAEIAGLVARDGTLKLDVARVSADLAQVVEQRLKPLETAGVSEIRRAEPRSSQ